MAHTLLFALTRAGVIALLAISAYGFGAPLLGRVRFVARMERVVFAIALGLGILGTALLVLGLVGALSRVPLILLMAAGAALAAAWPRPATAGFGLQAGSIGLDRAASLAIGAVVLGHVFLEALYPPTAFDATMYHLPMARAYITLGRVAPLPDLRFPVFPALNEMLFAGAMLLCDDLSAQLVEALFFALVTTGLLTWTARRGGTAPGLWALVLWLSSPLVTSLASIAYVDMGLTAFGLLAVYAFSCWLDSKEPGWLPLSGAFAGFAAGTKYTGLFFVGIVTAALLFMAARKPARRALLPFLSAAVAAGGSWYALNTYWTGNPVWPFLGDVFGYRFWTRGDLSSAMWSLRSLGWGHSPSALLLLPFHLLTSPDPSDLHAARAWFLLFPLALWGALRQRADRWLGTILIAYFLFWFSTTQQVRLLLPVAPVLSLLGAAGLAALTDLARGNWRARLRRLMSVGMLLLWGGVQYREGKALWVGSTVPSTPAARDAYLERLPSYRFYRDLNRRLKGAYTIYALHDESMKYYCDGRHLGDWFGPGRYEDAPLSSGQALFAWLRGLDASYLLVNTRFLTKPLPSDSSFQAHFEPIYENGLIVAFSLKP